MHHPVRGDPVSPLKPSLGVGPLFKGNYAPAPHQAAEMGNFLVLLSTTLGPQLGGGKGLEAWSSPAVQLREEPGLGGHLQ